MGTLASWWNGRHAGVKLRCCKASRFESERGYQKKKRTEVVRFEVDPSGVEPESG